MDIQSQIGSKKGAWFYCFRLLVLVIPIIVVPIIIFKSQTIILCQSATGSAPLVTMVSIGDVLGPYIVYTVHSVLCTLCQ